MLIQQYFSDLNTGLEGRVMATGLKLATAGYIRTTIHRWLVPVTRSIRGKEVGRRARAMRTQGSLTFLFVNGALGGGTR